MKFSSDFDYKDNYLFKHKPKNVDQIHLLEKFEKIIKITSRISLKQVASLLKISLNDFLYLLMEWGESLPFKIEGEDLIIDNKHINLKEIDELYDQWTDNEKT